MKFLFYIAIIFLLFINARGFLIEEIYESPGPQYFGLMPVEISDEEQAKHNYGGLSCRYFRFFKTLHSFNTYYLDNGKPLLTCPFLYDKEFYKVRQ